jgi:acetolactate synthase-1/2/3 large subunit
MSSVSNILFNKLKKLNVKTVFGYTGGAILPVINQFYKSQSPRLIVPKTELGGSFMAEGYAKMNLNKKPGVIISTSGPGATNLVTSLQNALMDGTPLLALTGQVPTSVLGTDAFQEADIVGITTPCTKWNTMLKNPKNTEYIIQKGYDIALCGRPGPVLIDLPKDITSQKVNDQNDKKWVNKNEKNDCLSNELIDIIKKSKRPIIISGQGALEESEGLRLFSKKNNIPVTTTLLGLGALNENDSNSLEMLGMHGSYTANKIVQRADLILALGARLDDRVIGKADEFGREAKNIIHVDIRNGNKERTIKGTNFVKSDIKEILSQLNSIEFSSNIVKERLNWLKYGESLKREYPFVVDEQNNELTCGFILQELNKIIEDTPNKKYCIVADVGVHQMLAAQHIKYDYPRVKYITSGGLGSMGFALPAAMGAKLAKPEYEVICIVGDGGFNMSLQELRTLHDYSINVKVIVMNNNCQQMVKMWQNIFYEKRYIGVHNTNPDYKKVAESLGVSGCTINSKEKVGYDLNKILFENKSVVVDAIISRNEYVYPMVLPGKAIDEMILKDSKKN